MNGQSAAQLTRERRYRGAPCSNAPTPCGSRAARSRIMRLAVCLVAFQVDAAGQPISAGEIRLL
jgi:hypothetical protein